MELSDRKKKILKAVVDNYIETAEPVGSKAIAADLGLSSATIRNEMAELEAMGYLEQPHTSAGRIPSPLGYRIYVNELMRRHKLSLEETERINSALHSRIQQFDQLLSNVGQLTSQLTNLPAYALSPALSRVTVLRYDFLYVDEGTFILVIMLDNNSVKSQLVRLPAKTSEEHLKKLCAIFNAMFTGKTDEEMSPALIASVEQATGDRMGTVAVIAAYVIDVLSQSRTSHAYLSGTSHLLRHPEYRDVRKAQKLLDYLSDGQQLARFPSPDDNSPIQILIGPENVAEQLQDSSVIAVSYDAGENMKGLVGVVGPTRMDYAQVAAKLQYIAQWLNILLHNAGGFLPTDTDFKNK